METNDLIKSLGGIAAVARICRVRPPSVHEWVGRNRIPADRCEQIEQASGGAVRCEDLRPDLDWHRDDQGRAYYRERREPEAA